MSLFSFGGKGGGPEIPEEGLSDLTTADIPKSKYETGHTNLKDCQDAALESENSFLAALKSVEDVLEIRDGVHLYQVVNGKPVQSKEGFDILRKALDKRILLLKKTFERYLADEADLELFEDRAKDSEEDKA